MDYKHRIIILLMLLSTLTIATVQAQNDGTPTPEPTASVTILATETAIATNTVEPTATPSIEVTASPEATVSAETATPLPATATPTETPTTESTTEPAATPDYGGDAHEPDSADSPQMYTGRVRRSFNPTNDSDYIALRIKPGITILETSALTGAADTRLTVYKKGTNSMMGTDDDSGVGLASRIVLNAGSDFDILVVIENRSMGYGADVGYDFFVIQQAEFTPTPTSAATAIRTATPYPTYTPFPTFTATPQPTGTPAPTWTPFPTYTPYPTIRPTAQPTQQRWPTATATTGKQWPTRTPVPTTTPIPTATTIATATATPVLPTPTPDWLATKEARRIAWEATNEATQAAATQTAEAWPTVTTPRVPVAASSQQQIAGTVSRDPIPTNTPTANSFMRVEVFIDMDADKLLDAGEGMQQVKVIVNDLLNQFSFSGFTNDGVLFVPLWDGIDANTLQIAVPYLSETRSLSAENDDDKDTEAVQTNTRTVQFTVDAPLLPIALP